MENFEPNFTEEVVEPVVEEKKTDVFGLISMIASIVGIVSCAAPFSIAAIVLAFISKSKVGVLEGKAKTGLILGIVGTVLGAIFWIVYIVFIVGMSAMGYY